MYLLWVVMIYFVSSGTLYSFFTQLLLYSSNSKPVADEVHTRMCIFVWCRSASSWLKSPITNDYNKFHDSIPDCCDQKEETEDEKVETLLKILLRRDDRLLPAFYDALEETDQKYVADILRQNVLQQQRQQEGDTRFMIIMAALCNRAGHYTFAPVFFLLSSSFFSLPNLSGRRLDVYHTLTHGMAIVRI